MIWPGIRLGQALETAPIFVDGDWVESKDQDPEGDVRLIQLADVGDGFYIDKSNRFLTSAAAERLKCTFLEPGDLLLARMPDPLGRACVFPGDPKRAVTVVDVCVIRVDKSRMDARWLMHCINSPGVRSEIGGYVTGTTRSRISRGNLSKVEIHLPPLPEQRRIAAILDQADALRAKRRQALAQLDSLTQSIFIEMFGDFVANPRGFSVSLLGKVCDVRDGTHDSPKYVTDGYPLVTSKNLSEGYVDLTDVNLITERDYDAINKRSKVDRGDLLMPMIGTIGNPVLIEHDPVYAVKNVAIVKFPKGSPSNIFIRAVLSGAYFDHVASQKNRGGTQKFLSLGDLRAIPVPLPPPALQHTFATRIQAAESLKTSHRAAAAELDALFASLQHRAFAGQLS